VSVRSGIKARSRADWWMREQAVISLPQGRDTMPDTSLIKKRDGKQVIVREFRECEVDVSIDKTLVTLPIDEWRALPLWNGKLSSL